MATKNLFLHIAAISILSILNLLAQAQDPKKVKIPPEQLKAIQTLIQQGMAQQSSDPQAAVKSFSDALSIVPQEPALYVYRGRVYFIALNNPVAAKADFTRAIELSPKFLMSYFYRGLANLNLQLLPEAERDLLYFVRTEKKQMDAYFNLGIVQNLLGKHDSAIASFSQALRLKPQDALLYYERGNVYRAVEKYKEALQDYKQAIVLNPSLLKARINNAALRGMTKDYQGAIEDYTYIINNTPPDVLSFYNRGYAYFLTGQYDKAINDFTEAIKLDSSTLNARLLRIQALQASGKIPKALEEIQGLLKTNAQDRKAFSNAGGLVRAQMQSDEFVINSSALQARAEMRSSLGDRQGACRDMSKSAALGNPVAQKQRPNLCAPPPSSIFLPANNFPENLQFFPRNAKDSSIVPLVGVLTQAGFDSVYTIVSKNGIFQKRASYPLSYNTILRGTEILSQATISVGVSIHAELAEYSVRLGVKSAKQDTILAVRDSLVCGDVFLVSGQSNSVLGTFPRTPHNEYLRTFYLGNNDSYWGLAEANNTNDDYNVGGFALTLQELIATTHNIPVCVLNGGLSASTIEQHFRNDATPTDPRSWYARLGWRAKESGLAKYAKAMIWYQGESNQGAGYTEKFVKLYQAWKQDYPSLQKIYAVQIRPSDCGQTDHATLREQQRSLPQRFPDTEVIAAAGLPAHDGCHYGTEGYTALGNQLYHLVARDFYGSTDTIGIRSPNLRRAYWTNAERKELALVFTTNDSLTISKDTNVGGKLRTFAKDAWLLDGKPLQATSVRIESKNTVVLSLSAPSNAQTISYVPERCYSDSPEAPCQVYEGPWLLNRRGVGALTFHNVPIETAP